MRAAGAVEQARSTSWPDGVKGDLNPALVSLGLVPHVFVVFINCCLGFCVVIWLLLYLFC